MIANNDATTGGRPPAASARAAERAPWRSAGNYVTAHPPLKDCEHPLWRIARQGLTKKECLFRRHRRVYVGARAGQRPRGAARSLSERASETPRKRSATSAAVGQRERLDKTAAACELRSAWTSKGEGGSHSPQHYTRAPTLPPSCSPHSDTPTYIHLYMYIYIYMLFVFIYRYVCIYIYICIYTYIYMHPPLARLRPGTGHLARTWAPGFH